MSPQVLPTTSFAVTVPKPSNIYVYYQNTEAAIVQSVYNRGWTGGVTSTLPFKAATSTPLAAVNLTVNGQEWLRVYYLSPDYKLKEACYVTGKGWYSGGLDAQNVQAAANSSIAAFSFDDVGQTSIRVYYQEAKTNKLQEYCYTNERWFSGATNLPTALSGTGIAAISYYFEGQLQHRLYYQAEDLTIREHALVGASWVPGVFNGGVAPGQTPIGALFLSGLGTVLDVYWMDLKQQIVHSMRENSVWSTNSIAEQATKAGSKFAIVGWQGGKVIRGYYQTQDRGVREVCKNSFEGSWVPGATLASGW
ncbi:fungal fucose-specific lectin-domain-containing protein [Daedaleopsis nitida]|nr:fungal fucose-specific lectin-domain-containing protein [Daedaleopsis nitida]